MKLIVGLGNPGLFYKNSRHNIGIRVIQALAKEYKVSLVRDKTALYKEGCATLKGSAFLLAYPLSFMNLSGMSVGSLVKKHRIQLEDLLVICDDLDLRLGNIRIRPAGSSGGHRGIASIIEHLESNAFSRLRIGIGRPVAKARIKDFVLTGFKKGESPLVNEAIEKAVEVSKAWLQFGIKEAMNKFNRKRVNNEKV